MRSGRLALALVSCAFAFATGSPAIADVIEVAEDGTSTYRIGSGAVQWLTQAQRDGADERGAAAGVTLTAAPRAPAVYADAVSRIAAKYRINPAMLEALVWQESRWNPRAVSRVGALGLAQLMPATARALGVDPRDPIANLDGGARYLRAQLDTFGGDVEKALAAYNAGPGRVLRAGGIPPIAETRAYVAAIIGRLASHSKGE